MKVKVYWILLVAVIGIVVITSLYLFSPRDPSSRGPEFSSNEVTKMVTSYFKEAEYIYETPPSTAYTEVKYMGEGKWSGKYNGPSAYGEKSTIIWDFYEEVKAVQIILGYSIE
ncbi:MAG: hypothetical protein V3R96_06420 [Dehalococcoidales bacterium]